MKLVAAVSRIGATSNLHQLFFGVIFMALGESADCDLPNVADVDLFGCSQQPTSCDCPPNTGSPEVNL